MTKEIRNRIFNLSEGTSHSVGLPAWALTPYFALPSTGVNLMVGQAVTIYGDSLINVPIVNNLNVTYTCDIGSQTGNNYTIDPVTGDIGNHDLTMVFKNAEATFLTKTITLNVSAKFLTGAARVLRIGDSTMAEGIASSVNTILSSTTIEWLGTQGTTYKHEGHAGWAWVNFATGEVGNPFWKSGVLDIAAYFTDNTIAVPDVVYIRLGINDVFNSNYVQATVLGYSQTLVDAFLAYNAKLKIIIALPTTCVNDSATWLSDYPTGGQDAYIEKIHSYSAALATKYAGGAYNARVDCSYEVINLSRTVTTGYQNGVHPANAGYQMLAEGFAGYLSKTLTNHFGAELVDQTAWCAAGGAYWNFQFDANWTADNSKLISSGNGSIIRVNFWTGGKTYRVAIITGGYAAGYFRAFYDGSLYQETLPLEVITVDTLYMWNYTLGGSGSKLLVNLAAGGYEGNISKLTIREIL